MQDPVVRGRIQRRTVATVLFACSLNNFILAPLMEHISPNEAAAVLVYGCMGIVGAQIAFGATYCIIAPFPLAKRIVIAGGAGLVLFGAWCLGFLVGQRVNLQYITWDEIRMLLCLPLLIVAIQMPLWVAKCWLGWRIVALPDRIDEPSSRSFGIRDLLVAMAVGAAVLSSAQLAVPSYSSTEDFLVTMVIAAVVLVAVSLFVTFPTVLAIWRARQLKWALVALILYDAAFLWGAIELVVVLTKTDTWSLRLGFMTMGTVLLTALTGGMLLCRGLGWRLLWGRSAGVVAEPTHDEVGCQQVETSS